MSPSGKYLLFLELCNTLKDAPLYTLVRGCRDQSTLFFQHEQKSRASGTVQILLSRLRVKMIWSAAPCYMTKVTTFQAWLFWVDIICNAVDKPMCKRFLASEVNTPISGTINTSIPSGIRQVNVPVSSVIGVHLVASSTWTKVKEDWEGECWLSRGVLYIVCKYLPKMKKMRLFATHLVQGNPSWKNIVQNKISYLLVGNSCKEPA